MRVFFFILIIYCFTGCQEDKISKNVNVFITMGQSNSVGNVLKINEPLQEYNNIYSTHESIFDYPMQLSYIKFSDSTVNKAFPIDYFTSKNLYLANSATYFAKHYKSKDTLFIINIAIGGTGLGPTSTNNLWSMTRYDFDNRSIYPRMMHYFRAFFKQLKKEGKNVTLIGVDWNQWESEDPKVDANEYFFHYMTFFNFLGTVMPKPDFNLFLCKPTSQYFKHHKRVLEAFEKIKTVRPNTIIYDPKDLNQNSNIFLDDGIHYNAKTLEKIGEFLYLNTLKK